VAAPRSPESGSQAEAEAPPLKAAPSAAAAFVAASRRYLCAEYPAKLDRALDLLPPEDVWWRPDPATNSVGHLLHHLSGNVRQWVVHGIGGAPDERDRAAEFGSDEVPLDVLRRRLGDSLRDAGDVLSTLDPGTLGDVRAIQGLRTTVLDALYHVVEHFSMHTGQILWIVKARSGRDLGFYGVDDDGRVVETRW